MITFLNIKNDNGILKYNYCEVNRTEDLGYAEIDLKTFEPVRVDYSSADKQAVTAHGFLRSVWALKKILSKDIDIKSFSLPDPYHYCWF